MMQVEQLFGTPLIADDLPVSPELAALPGALFAAGRSDVGRSMNLGTGRWAAAPWPIAASGAIGHMLALANRATQDIRAPQQAPDWTVALSIHVARAPMPVPPHYDAFWTALYILRPSEGGGDRLEIQDPRLPMTMGEDPNLRLRAIGAKTPSFYQPTVDIAVTRGMMFLFPSWLDVRYVSGQAEGAGYAFLQAGLIAPLA
ncbi:2OG-Fe(II) oxygenase family protein [Sphingomonas sanguinis]|jgi:hypothetical protein|uniref:Uncharacterized protein n=1 Tax=Sphingomonas sanguinis TaxID=33051 RepID=A0A7Y7US67_9SPHN|nr:hypothetical protein [Sphingomonas sanguinis]MBZ6383359.1 2OG-Fe(II) oxygenase family protein [Sphingomonas sanguinis]NNG48572.1 hypothetical protein [Sphingomonas sanguinis]NNG54205.1 hypothetical protein [Sphingomonas sanguinis]NVP32654.1 hypothetical protein [Sphingomonas sanguinis]HJO64092.1 hypothetical protein [Sphingomonas sanguinis]